MKKAVPFLIATLIVCSGFAQQNVTKWKVDVSPQKAFVENKGQFDNLDVPDQVQSRN